MGGAWHCRGGCGQNRGTAPEHLSKPVISPWAPLQTPPRGRAGTHHRHPQTHGVSQALLRPQAALALQAWPCLPLLRGPLVPTGHVGGQRLRLPGCCAQVGERLGRYEVEKRCAVEKEDYDLAKHRKRQMEQYRAQVYAQLELHSLVDAELVGAARPRARAAHPAGSALRNISNCVPTTVVSALPGSGRPHSRAERGGALAPQCSSWVRSCLLLGAVGKKPQGPRPHPQTHSGRSAPTLQVRRQAEQIERLSADGRPLPGSRSRCAALAV